MKTYISPTTYYCLTATSSLMQGTIADSGIGGSGSGGSQGGSRVPEMD